jgi:hypothetical protein
MLRRDSEDLFRPWPKTEPPPTSGPPYRLQQNKYGVSSATSYKSQLTREVVTISSPEWVNVTSVTVTRGRSADQTHGEVLFLTEIATGL